MWLSDNFLLSDFMGCDSIYRKGYANSIPSSDCIKEGKYLCESLLEGILESYGLFSISYGYISPNLSRKIVSYQDPDKPSYHRWDKGAAADICVHSWVSEDNDNTEYSAPVLLGYELDKQFDYSRMITYSESPFICIATQISEGYKPRKAFYENRYIGHKKPLFIRKPYGNARAASIIDTIPNVIDWRGGGYPSYHGGGVRQYHHIRTSDYTVLSDFLYNDDIVMSTQRVKANIRDILPALYKAAMVYDDLVRLMSDIKRLPIIRGYIDSHSRGERDADWVHDFSFDVAVPRYADINTVADAAMSLDSLHTVAKGKNDRSVHIAGYLR